MDKRHGPREQMVYFKAKTDNEVCEDRVWNMYVL